MEERKESDIDWAILKGPLIVLSICFIFSSLLIGGSYYFNNNLEKEYKRNKSVFKSVSRKYLDVDEEEKILRENYPIFVDLYNKGIIGREQRLNWIETLRQAGEKVKVPSLVYSIDTREEYTPAFNINYSGYTLYRSGMRLDLGLLHEGDLFKLIDYINHTANGTYTLTECDFTMTGREIKFDKGRANITASCLLYWITINLAGDLEIEIG